MKKTFAFVIVFLMVFSAFPMLTRSAQAAGTPPETTLTIGEPKHVNERTTVIPSTTFTLDASDPDGDLNSTLYRINSTAESYESGWLTCEVPFTFDLSLLTNGNYTLQYYSNDTAGNEEPIHTVELTLIRASDCKGDLSGDGKCNILDIVKITTIYRSHVGNENWNPTFDITKDEILDILDIVSIIIYYGGNS